MRLARGLARAAEEGVRRRAEDTPARRRHRQHGSAVVDRRGQGLLDVDVLPGLQRGDDRARVVHRRGQVDDDVHRVVGVQLVVRPPSPECRAQRRPAWPGPTSMSPTRTISSSG